jgi:hypothetical protein
MSKAIRTILVSFVSAILLTTVTMAQTNGNADKQKASKEHHGRLSKVAFWRHHKQDKGAKQAESANPQRAKNKTAQLKPVSAKSTTSGKQSASKKTQAQEQHPSSMSKSSGKPVSKSASSTQPATVKKTKAPATKSTAATDSKSRPKV